MMHKETYQKERSRTWKERHAKGVPVKMTWEEFAKCCDRTKSVNGIVRGLDHGEYPKAWAGGNNVVFCNFRYKPEWMSKKHPLPAPQPHIGEFSDQIIVWP